MSRNNKSTFMVTLDGKNVPISELAERNKNDRLIHEHLKLQVEIIEYEDRLDQTKRRITDLLFRVKSNLLSKLKEKNMGPVAEEIVESSFLEFGIPTSKELIEATRNEMKEMFSGEQKDTPIDEVPDQPAMPPHMNETEETNL